MKSDQISLDRFVKAQETTYNIALSELKSGRKCSHWMWFVFPQIDGLGHSPTTQFYSIKNRDEAVAYLNHDILGPRLFECTQAMLDIKGKSATNILGHPDDFKFCSSMTLFESVSTSDSIFSQAIEKYYAGNRDQKTLEILKGL